MSCRGPDAALVLSLTVLTPVPRPLPSPSVWSSCERALLLDPALMCTEIAGWPPCQAATLIAPAAPEKEWGEVDGSALHLLCLLLSLWLVTALRFHRPCSVVQGAAKVLVVLRWPALLSLQFWSLPESHRRSQVLWPHLPLPPWPSAQQED